MAFCRYCGAEISEHAFICVKCGATVNENNKLQSSDDGHWAWALLGLFFPLLGLVLYLIWSTEKPKTAKVVGIGALISGIFYASYILFFIVLLNSF